MKIPKKKLKVFLTLIYSINNTFAQTKKLLYKFTIYKNMLKYSNQCALHSYERNAFLKQQKIKSNLHERLSNPMLHVTEIYLPALVSLLAVSNGLPLFHFSVIGGDGTDQQIVLLRVHIFLHTPVYMSSLQILLFSPSPVVQLKNEPGIR